MTAQELVNDLARYGGMIVLADQCSVNDLEEARVENRIAIDDAAGLLLVRFSQARLDLYDKAFRFFKEVKSFESQMGGLNVAQD